MRADVTQILEAVKRGDQQASELLLPLVYDELRKLAESRMAREASGNTLQATALVHEAYIRLVGPDGGSNSKWEDRGHFFAAAAEAMRRILIDKARSGNAIKRGGGLQRTTLDSASLQAGCLSEEVLALDESLKKFAEEDPQKAELVKLRFFGGLTLKQAATILDISPTTADRYWAYARAWLYNDITSDS